MPAGLGAQCVVASRHEHQSVSELAAAQRFLEPSGADQVESDPGDAREIPVGGLFDTASVVALVQLGLAQ